MTPIGKDYFEGATRIHLVGIKGVGMTALAQMLKEEGFTVSGSDTDEKFFTDAILKNLRIRTSDGFNPLHIPPTTELIVHSAAYHTRNNSELSEAEKMEIPMITYPEALGRISQKKFGIGVAGTHGKTTTTAMLGTALNALGFDPTIICGSAMRDFGGYNARVGKSNIFIAETCEYRRHFLYFMPRCAIMTNVEAEHLDYFRDINDVRKAFVQYAQSIPEGGILVINNDDEQLRQVALSLDPALIQIVTYGINAPADWVARDIEFKDGLLQYTALFNGEPKTPITLQVPGIHNVYNSLAVVAFAYHFLHQFSQVGEVESLQAMRDALARFQGTVRRFDKRGETNGVTIYDDYAHHPTEIRAALNGARMMYPDARIWALFMPHTYSRTEALLNEFATAFTDADIVIINKIYGSAREQETGNVTGETLAAAIKSNKSDTVYIHGFRDTAEYVLKHMQPGDIIITMGAGNNWKISDLLLHPEETETSKPKSKLRLEGE